jgi:hypothetical protein
MRLPLASSLLLSVLLLAPRLEAAPAAQNHFQARPTAVYVQLGLGTPLGWGGVEVEQALTSVLVLSGGVGMGFEEPQYAFMPRLRFGNRHDAGTVGVGVSRGDFRVDDTCWQHCNPVAPQEGVLTWGNLEGGFEHRWANGLSVRAFVGLRLIVGGELACVGDLPCSRGYARHTAFTGGAFGWAF